MLEAMNSGQEGSMCTLHANSPTEAFDRILILGLRGGLALAERAIHILVGMAVDLIVHMRRGYDGTRTVRYRVGDPRGHAARRHRAARPSTGCSCLTRRPAGPWRRTRHRRAMLTRLAAARLRCRPARPARRAALRGHRSRQGCGPVTALAGLAGGLAIAGLAAARPRADPAGAARRAAAAQAGITIAGRPASAC